ncbi:MAG TPA: GGDEF domain-containing protein [Capillimicrobium sp.]|nr:GGDEF domain-containing protein [Capillimicrobium sp.]
MEAPTGADALALLRGPTRAYMANADLTLVRRAGPLAYVLTAVCALIVMAFVPPTALLPPAAGWAIGGTYVGFGAGAGIWLSRSRNASLRAIYAVSLALVTGLGLLGWLAEDGDLYAALPLLPLVVVAAVYSPLQVAGALLVALAAQVPALLAIGADSDSVLELLLQAFTWLCVCSLALLSTANVRVQREALHAHARVDALTGLGNRRAFDEALAVELARAVRSGQPLSLLVGDLDGFKGINDRHGHLAGDRCLADVAAVVRDLTRRPDSCFRWGGDEFAVLLPEADADRAEAVAERLTAAIAGTCRTPDGAPMSIAFGVAERRDDEADPAALLARADTALLAVKTAPPARRAAAS